MNFNKKFVKYKERIIKYLDCFFLEKENRLSEVNMWAGDVINKTRLFMKDGKMLRGCLAVLSYVMSGKKVNADIIKAASAIELFHSAFLVHDDIMDRDTVRRGRKSVYYQYKLFADRHALNDSGHFGESMGICAGDVLIFFAFEILRAPATPTTLSS